MATRDVKDRSQAAVNAKVWSQGRLVGEYASRELSPAERVALDRYAEPLSGHVLELGCGAGRVTGHLISRATSVYGIDVMPEMVEYSRRTYPGGSFGVADLRDISWMRPRCFDAVVAIANVLDVLDDPGRREVLADVRELLAPGGILLMTSHNLAAAPSIPPPGRVEGTTVRQRLKSAARLPRRTLNHRRLRHLERVGRDHAVLVDVAHDYSLLHYYIGRDAQEAQFAEQGLRLLDCLAEDGTRVPRGEPAAACHSLLYVARSGDRVPAGRQP